MAKKICSQCGTVGKAKLKTPGSFLLELILWLFFIIPGVIYSLWRLGARETVCRSCGGHLIPVKSPRGKALLAELGGGR